MSTQTEAPQRCRYNRLEVTPYAWRNGTLYGLGDQWALMAKPPFSRPPLAEAAWAHALPARFTTQLNTLEDHRERLPRLSMDKRTIVNTGRLFDVHPLGIDHTVDAELVAICQRAVDRALDWRVATIRDRNNQQLPVAVAFTRDGKLAAIIAGRETANDQPYTP